MDQELTSQIELSLASSLQNPAVVTHLTCSHSTVDTVVMVATDRCVHVFRQELRSAMKERPTLHHIVNGIVKST